MIDRLVTLAGLGRSVVMYYGQPWRVWPMQRFMRELLQPGALAFDIGAHVGNRTLAMTEAGARVVALEPQPACRRILIRLARNRPITVRAEAVGAAAGTQVLHVSRRHPTLSTTTDAWPERMGQADGFRTIRWDDSVTVPMVTLDALVAEYGQPDFVKIDVEGGEAEALAGLSTAVPLVAFEYLPSAMDVTEKCLDRLGRLGTYEFNLVIGERQRFDRLDWVPISAFHDRLRRAAASGASGDVYARLSADPS